jgi:phosphate transport system protein
MLDRRHTDREFENELETLRERVLLMGARVEEMLTLAFRSFAERDVRIAQNTIPLDRQIDQLEIGIDELCLQILARRQPVASDLRFITTTLKLVTDLERIADLCVNVCERVVELSSEPWPADNTPIPAVAAIAQGMVHDALDSFVDHNAVQARDVIERDGVVDAYYAQLFPQLMSQMMSDPNLVTRSTRLLSVGKYIERIGDHATNIAEMVVFMVNGQDVRHLGPPSG